MAPTETDILRLAQVAQEATFESSRWPDFLSGVASLVGADVVMIQRHYLAQHRSQTIVTFGMTPRLKASYNDYYSRLNVWREHGQHLYVPGRVVTDPEMYPRALLKRSEFYNECLAPNGVSYSLAGVVARRRDEAVTLVALRQDRRPSWEDSFRPAIATLVPHVARAQQAEERLTMMAAGEMALNALNIGALLVDGDGMVVFHNDAARQIVIDGNDGLSIQNDQLVARHPLADAALRRLVAHATAPGRSLDVPPDVLVARPSLRRPYFVTASSLSASLRPFLGMRRPAALVLITDPELRSPIAADALRQGYGLTRKEAQLAMALADGLTLERAADKLGIRYQTARTHLRRILSKTQTSRQAELVTLIERFSR